MTIFVLLKKFSTGSVFWNKEIKTLCADMNRENHQSARSVAFDVRLHTGFDAKQKELAKDCADTEEDPATCGSQFPLASSITGLFDERLKGEATGEDGSPLDHHGCAMKNGAKMYTLEVSDGHDDGFWNENQQAMERRTRAPKPAARVLRPLEELEGLLQ